jgi:hypothetical protein
VRDAAQSVSWQTETPWAPKKKRKTRLFGTWAATAPRHFISDRRDDLASAFLLAYEAVTSPDDAVRAAAAGRAFFITSPWKMHTLEFFTWVQQLGEGGEETKIYSGSAVCAR